MKLSKCPPKDKNKNKKIALLERSKLNSMVKIIPKAPIDLDISHEEFRVVINEEKYYPRLIKKHQNKR